MHPSAAGLAVPGAAGCPQTWRREELCWWCWARGGVWDLLSSQRPALRGCVGSWARRKARRVAQAALAQRPPAWLVTAVSTSAPPPTWVLPDPERPEKRNLKDFASPEAGRREMLAVRMPDQSQNWSQGN